MPKTWTAGDVLDIIRGFQPACVVAAAAELDLFSALAGGPLSARELAGEISADLRGTTVLADALAALGLLLKDAGLYRLADGVAKLLTAKGRASVLNMARHQANCLRRWAQLAHVVKTGRPGQRTASILGDEGDTASFIGAMNEISQATAPKLVAEVGPPPFKHLLDVGGGSGTWTIAFLQAGAPQAAATLFDLPDVIPLARQRLSAAGLADRVKLVPGDLYIDDLPAGADLAWVSAIVHMNSRRQNRELFAKVHTALADEGRVLIRDVVMEPDRTHPPGGAMFAVNMLAGTEGGGTFTFEEIHKDLQSAGFVQAKLLYQDDGMNSVVQAIKTQ